jgi:hypothetical protein
MTIVALEDMLPPIEPFSEERWNAIQDSIETERTRISELRKDRRE